MTDTKELKQQKKVTCGCNHKDPDYWCVCFFEGYMMGETEQIWKTEDSIKEAQKEVVKNIILERVENGADYILFFKKDSMDLKYLSWPAGTQHKGKVLFVPVSDIKNIKFIKKKYLEGEKE